MIVELFDFENDQSLDDRKPPMIIDDDAINLKYEKGETRIITEQGAFKLPLIASIFAGGNYKLRPNYQRRIVWDDKKRSKLVESFIINVPVPPVFVYEQDFNSYEVMDGLQRISALIDFYQDKYALEGLTEWPELNGRIYSQLPIKVKEGIDRRQLQSITLLKESTRDFGRANELKKMVFERLNTGGIRLEDQEIRNALYDGVFNRLCIELSEYANFQKLWGIIKQNGDMDETDIDSEESAMSLAGNKLYMRMYDVELVLRFFAMRRIEYYHGQLSVFFDEYLIRGNQYTEEQLMTLKKVFVSTVDKAFLIFGDKAYCQYGLLRGKYRWSTPQKFIYDPMMIALTRFEYDERTAYDVTNNVELLRMLYEENESAFNGKTQSKSDIIMRAELFFGLLKAIK